MALVTGLIVALILLGLYARGTGRGLYLAAAVPVLIYMYYVYHSG